MTGQCFGRWTVLDSFVRTIKGEKKWLCRCECGTQRYVLERSLRSGGSQSCGCLRRERVKETVGLNLVGKTFGDLTVIRVADSDRQKKNGGICWLCSCSCGNECVVPGTLLVTGRRVSCPACRKRTNNYASVNIAGRRYNRLTALYPTQNRSKKGYVIWHCCCDCGNVVDVSYNELVYGNMKSCGCQKKEHDQKLQTNLTRVDGTSIDSISSKKVPANNTTGCKGVYLVRGKYLAKIVFQKKQYYLGSFDKYEDAVQARIGAEELLFDQTAEFYSAWQVCAENDPEWAGQNPVQIAVSQNADKQLTVTYSPLLPKAENTNNR